MNENDTTPLLSAFPYERPQRVDISEELAAHEESHTGRYLREVL